MTDNKTQACPLGENRCPIYSDIERLNSEVRKLRQQVARDSLTGLYNKGHFDTALATEMERSRRSRLPTSLILLDIDHFKVINDRYGHVAGDRVLERFARVLENTVRLIDISCRYGGEEFAVVLPATPLLVATQVAERLRTAIAKTEVNADNAVITFTASLGVSSYNYDQKATPEELVNRADRELYSAKQQGRNRVHSERLTRISAQLSDNEKAALFGHDNSSA